MRPPQPRTLLFATALGTAGLLAAIWYFQPQVYDTARHAERLTVYEGLPHPMYEKEAFQEESKSKQTIKLLGFPFYSEPLELNDEDVRTLRNLLGNRNTYEAYSGEKKCGGFHPDYAVEWSVEGKVYHCLICFGCSEAKFEDAQGETLFYDLRSEGFGHDRKMRLLDLLKAYRKNRPLHARFGTGPLAGLDKRLGPVF